MTLILLRHSRGINVICRYGGAQVPVLPGETSQAGARPYPGRIRHGLSSYPLAHRRRGTARFGLAPRPHAVAPDAAIIVITGLGDMKTAIESLKCGAYDFIVKPVNVEEVLIAAERALERRQLLMERREYHTLLERRVDEATRDLAAALNELEDTYRTTLEALGSALDTRDVGTHAHSRRVVGYSLALARAHNLPESQMRDIEHGVLLHDIGKIGIPDGILLKPGPLGPEEWKIMRTHPDLGRRLVEPIPFLRGAVPIVYHHHERWDGTGYPAGLRAESIPLAPRTFALADAFDAMTYNRPYSIAISFEAARQEIQRCAGTHFDPAVVETFLKIPLELIETIRNGSGQSVQRATSVPLTREH